MGWFFLERHNCERRAGFQENHFPKKETLLFIEFDYDHSLVKRQRETLTVHVEKENRETGNEKLAISRRK